MTSQPTPKPKSPKLLTGVTVLGRVGVVIALASTGAGWYANRWLHKFIRNDLRPLVQNSLTQQLQRPVNLGAVEDYSWNGIRFGASSIPATPTDPDRVAVEAIEVSFNPLDVLSPRRTIHLHANLVRPKAYINEDAKGVWLATQLKQLPDQGPVKIELDSAQIQDAEITLSPRLEKGQRQSQPLTIRGVQAQTWFQDNYQRVRFQAQGQPTIGGQFKLFGHYLTARQQFQFQAQGQRLSVPWLDHLLHLPWTFQAGIGEGDLAVDFTPGKPVLLQGHANFQDVALKIDELPQTIRQAKGKLSFQGEQITVVSAQGHYGLVPGELIGTADPKLGLNLSGKAKSVAIADAQKTINLQLPFATAGKIGVDFKITGSYQQPILAGAVQSIGPLRADEVDFTTARANFQLKGSLVSIENVLATPIFGGNVTGNGTVSLANQGQLGLKFRAERLPVQAIAKIYAPLPFVTTGEVASDVELTGGFVEPVLSGTIQATQPLLVDQLRLQSATARFRAVNNVAQLSGIEAQPVIGGRITGKGTLDLNPKGEVALQFDAQNLPGESLAELYGQKPDIKIGPLAATLTVKVPLPADRTQPVEANAVQTLVDWQAPAAQYPAKGQATVLADRTLLRNTTLQVEGGEIALNGQLIGDRWQADADLNRIRLQPFSPDLRGRLSGRLQLTGTTEDLSVAATRAVGSVRLSQGIALIGAPITAQVQWAGDRLQVAHAVADGFSAQGTVFTETTRASEVPAIKNLDLNVALQNYNLKTLLVATESSVPAGVELQGRVNYAGQITGGLDTVATSGAVGLQGFKLNGVAFEPRLSGRLRYHAQSGLEVAVKGQVDQLALAVDAQNRPMQFRLQKQKAIVVGESDGDLLQVKVRDLPLELLPKITATGTSPQTAKGLLAGDFQVDWQKQTGQGEVQIQHPQLGTFVGDRFVGKIRYANQVAELLQGRLQQRQSLYDVAGRFNLAAKGTQPQLQATVNVVQGNIQDALALVQWFDLEDIQRGFNPPQFAKAADVRPNPIELPDNLTLQEQLERFAYFTALHNQAKTQQPQTVHLPPLNTLAGQFRGNLRLQGSLERGVAVDFNLQGQDWKWDTYQFGQVVAQGRWVNDQLTLLPVTVQSGEAGATFRGQVGNQTQDGELVLHNIAIADVKRFFNLDLAATGLVNGTVKLGGNRDNPTAEGRLTLADGTLKDEKVQAAQADFKYADARLNFNSQAAIAQPEPVFIAGNLPLPLPFMTVKPSSDQIQLDVNVKNEALGLLNLLNSQVKWQEGMGQVNVQVRGTLQKPLATGTATLVDASLLSAALPEPLKQVNGSIRFDNELVQVEGITGKLGSGTVSAVGVIPLSNTLGRSRSPQRQPLLPVQPLTVDLEKVSIQLPKLYRGGVSGQLIVTGSVPEPILSGGLTLVDGLAYLPDTEGGSTPATPVLSWVDPPPSGGTGDANPGDLQVGDIDFESLNLNLGDRLRITGPLMNFVAKGNITLNGSLNDLRPQGTVSLLRGQVNIYTTLFTLDRLYPQTATFVPSQGLDPNLNVHMVTSVPEVTRVPLPQSPLESSEIAVQPSTSFGAFQTIRIEAIAKGPASQIQDNLQLKSSPARNTNEILALLGGGFVGTLEKGDSTLALANLAGSALFTNVQALINQNLGLVDLRIFPAVIPKRDSRNPTTIDLAGELGIPITRKFSASVLSVLTSREPLTLFNLRYRVNDEVQLRGSTDFVGENRVVVEFDKRF